jgi:Cu+-exporting ATPase
MNPTEKDPVCGMVVQPGWTSWTYQGNPYFFCCDGCLQRFKKEPEKFLSPKQPTESQACLDEVEHICPMHPEVRQKGPGTCPDCGMALEPATFSLEDTGPNPELVDFTRRFWLSTTLTLPLMILAMFFGLDARLQWFLATPVVIWAGAPLFVRGWESLRNRSPNRFTLIALGTGVSYAYSTVAAFFPEIFPAQFRMTGQEGMGHAAGQVGVYFEAAAGIVALVLLGQVLELRARARTSRALRELLALVPEKTRRVRFNGAEEEVDVREVKLGDRLRVLPGSKVPVDGVVLEGTSAIDESMVTGESLPVEKGPRDSVIGGTLNGRGSFLMRAMKVGDETLLARMVQQVAEAQRTRAPIQRLADRVSAVFVPAVVLSAILSAALWLIFGPEPRGAYALVNAVAVLIIACPCALGLATPMSILVGMGRGARAGLLFRNAESLEHLASVTVLAFDKTGTLTEGRPELLEVLPLGGVSREELLVSVAALERSSEHPLADAILRGVRSQGFPDDRWPAVTEFVSVPGSGIQGKVGADLWQVGSPPALSASGILFPESLKAQIAVLRSQGQTVIAVGRGRECAGFLGVKDPIQRSARQVLDELRSQKLELVMLTGDHEETAAVVARELGITQVHSALKPEQKAQWVKQAQAEGKRVAFAGDGVNDALALSCAHVGIAMGSGTQVAIESAGLTLLHGDLRGVLRALKLSRAVVRNIRQNLWLAFGYNTLGVPVAGGLLYPAFGILLSPLVASAAMSFSSVSVIANSLRLSKVRLNSEE